MELKSNVCSNIQMILHYTPRKIYDSIEYKQIINQLNVTENIELNYHSQSKEYPLFKLSEKIFSKLPSNIRKYSEL